MSNINITNVPEGTMSFDSSNFDEYESYAPVDQEQYNSPDYYMLRRNPMQVNPSDEMVQEQPAVDVQQEVNNIEYPVASQEEVMANQMMMEEQMKRKKPSGCGRKILLLISITVVLVLIGLLIYSLFVEYSESSESSGYSKSEPIVVNVQPSAPVQTGGSKLATMNYLNNMFNPNYGYSS